MRYFLLLIAGLLAIPWIARAQVVDSTASNVRDDLERALELFDLNDPDFDGEQLTQLLQDLATRPMNINRASADDLLIVPGLNLQKARAIVRYREDQKPFEQVDELLKVDGIGPATLERMRPYVTIGSGRMLGRDLYGNYRYWTTGGRFETLSRYQRTVQPQEGYMRADTNGGYLGSPNQYYQRFRYRSNHLSANITQQKDAGEPWTGTTGFDFNSGHIALENNGRLKELVIGDYTLFMGQGMVLWGGRTFGKGRDVIHPPNRNGRGVRPYGSSQESDFFRGVAATYGHNVQLTGFYSDRRLTASRISADTLRAPRDDGYHRTRRERSYKNSLGQKVYGGRLQAAFPVGVFGVTGYTTTFDKVIFPGNGITARYTFSGNQHAVGGMDYSLLAGPAVIYGEVGRSQNGALGFITGVQAPVGPDTEVMVAYRSYAADFQSMLGNGFGEQAGPPQNESGVYVGLRHSLSRRVRLSTYIDQYQFPAPRFGMHQPSRGYDWLALAEVRLRRGLQFYLQLRSEVKEQEYEAFDAGGRAQIRLDEGRRSTVRGQLEYRVNPKIRLRSRGEVVMSRPAGADAAYGYLMYQDLRFTPAPGWSVDARITVFETESYDTRLYQFENDLLYVFSSQVLYNQGQRMYLLMNVDLFSYLELWTKFGITIFENESVIGSGLNQIAGNKRTEVGFQLRLKF